MRKPNRIHFASPMAAVIIFSSILGTLVAEPLDKRFNFRGQEASPAAADCVLLTSMRRSAGRFKATRKGLAQYTLTTHGNAAWCVPNTDIKSDWLDAKLATLIEARVMIHRIEGKAGAFFQAFDGGHRYSVFFTPEGLVCIGAEEVHAVPVEHGKPHTFRLVSAGETNLTTLYIDGEKRLEYRALKHTLNGFNWGDGSSEPGNGAQCVWLDIRAQQAKTVAELLDSPAEAKGPSEAELKALVEVLATGTFKQRREARETLKTFGSALHEALRSFLKHENPEVRLSIRELLNGRD